MEPARRQQRRNPRPQGQQCETTFLRVKQFVDKNSLISKTSHTSKISYTSKTSYTSNTSYTSIHKTWPSGDTPEPAAKTSARWSLR